MKSTWTSLATVSVLLLGLIAACQSDPSPEVTTQTTAAPPPRVAPEADDPTPDQPTADQPTIDEPVTAPIVARTQAGIAPTAVDPLPQEKPKATTKPKPPEPGPQEKPGEFDADAFPPTVPDTPWHQNAWFKDDCLRCHETGAKEAPLVVHNKLPKILMQAKCRTCHVLIPGQQPRMRVIPQTPFDENAFPPMIPASASHRKAWTRDDCLLCHDTGVADATIVVHKTLPPIALKGKCRTCHVQVRVLDAVDAGKK